MVLDVEAFLLAFVIWKCILVVDSVFSMIRSAVLLFIG